VRVDVHAATLAVRDAGDGPALVLLHSGTGDGAEWDLVTPRLPGRRVVRPDLRGFGESPVGAEAFSHGEDVLAVMDALGLQAATLAGASFGGLVALEAATLAPQRFPALVLLAPALDDHDWSSEMETFGEAEEAALAAGDLDLATRLNVALWAPRLGPQLQARVAATQRRAFQLQSHAEGEARDPDPPVAARLDRLTMPARILVGDADLPDFPAIAERLARELPDARLEVLPGAGHLLALERPDAVAAAIAAAPAPA
jgi:pimeloyl-ACP methyl ester carboxylesterase